MSQRVQRESLVHRLKQRRLQLVELVMLLLLRILQMPRMLKQLSLLQPQPLGMKPNIQLHLKRVCLVHLQLLGLRQPIVQLIRHLRQGALRLQSQLLSTQNRWVI